MKPSDIIAVFSAILSSLALYLTLRKQRVEEHKASANEISDALSFISEAKVSLINFKGQVNKLERLFADHYPANLATLGTYREFIKLTNDNFTEEYRALVSQPKKKISTYDLILKKGHIQAQLKLLHELNKSVEEFFGNPEKQIANQRVDLTR